MSIARLIALACEDEPFEAILYSYEDSDLFSLRVDLWPPRREEEPSW